MKNWERQPSTKVPPKPQNLPLVIKYLYTQHGHLSAVHDLISNLNISSEAEILIFIKTFGQSCEIL